LQPDTALVQPKRGISDQSPTSALDNLRFIELFYT